jgi:hypothetical protein
MGRLNYILTAEPNIDDRGANDPESTKPQGEMNSAILRSVTRPTSQGPDQWRCKG